MISVDQLAEVLIAQQRELPSVNCLVYDQRLLPAQQLVEVMSFQTRHQCGFKAACTELGLWTDELADKISREFSQIRVPIGTYLIRKNYIQYTELINALDEYFSENPQEEQKESVQFREKIEVSDHKDNVVSLDSARNQGTIVLTQAKPLEMNGFHPEFTQLQESEVLDYLEILSADQPVLSGPETLAQIKTRGWGVPVIMVTSRNKMEDIARMLEEGAEEYIMKPFTAEVVIEKIEDVLGKKVA